jgi:hypothetical protein
MNKHIFTLSACLVALSIVPCSAFAETDAPQITEISDEEAHEAFTLLKASEKERVVRQDKEREVAAKLRREEEVRRAAEAQLKLEQERLRLDAELKQSLVKLEKHRLEIESQRPLYGYYPATPVQSYPEHQVYGSYQGHNTSFAVNLGTVPAQQSIRPYGLPTLGSATPNPGW